MPTDNTPCLSDQDFASAEKDLYASHTQPATYRNHEERDVDSKGNIYEDRQVQGSPFDMDSKTNKGREEDAPQPRSPHIIAQKQNGKDLIGGQNGNANFDQSFVKPPPTKPAIPRC